MRQLIFSLTCFGLIACVGKAPVNTGDDDVDVDGGVDSPPADEGQLVSGKTMDYFTNLASSAATVETDGVIPSMTSTSGSDGAYSLEHVPTGSKLFLTATRTNYRATRNVTTTVAGVPVITDVYLLANADVARQYASVGKALVAGKAFVAIDLQKKDGTPLVGAAIADVTLVDAANVPVPGIATFFFGAAGDLDQALLVSTLVNGRARAGILDVPPGTFTIKVTYVEAALPVTLTTLIVATADGATLAATADLGGPGSGNLVDPKFTTDIYPLLQKAANGGLGCANCHTAGGTAALLKYDDTPDITLANMKAKLGIIDLIAPVNSLLLTKPLYELPPALQNHPNATFLDITDVNYKQILRWITNGAKL